jgi:DHA2 family multidrug resistance protein
MAPACNAQARFQSGEGVLAAGGGSWAELDEGRRGLIAAGLMVATFIGALDMTVVNVSLPHMQGSLQASPEQITWVLTSYMVATAMTTPISSWLAGRVGMKAMLLVCIALFTLSSVLCGMAAGLPEMVGLRALQGIAFAPIPPLTQAVLLRINPPERHGRAMAAFTMATVAAPIIGPTLGGWITETLTWRWCFYVNLLPGAACLLLIWFFLPREDVSDRRFDFLGFGSLALAVGALQLMLDRGPSRDWFGSPEICIEALIAASAFWVYLTHTLTAKNPLFDPALVRDRNFVVGALFMFIIMLLLFASVSLLPLVMQNLLGYPAIETGLISMPRAVAIMAMLYLVGRLDTVVDRRLLALFGLSMLLVAFWRMAQFDLSMGAPTIMEATIIQGFGQGFVTVPVTTLALATILPSQRTDASTVLNLVRNMGGSIGVSMMQALMVINNQAMHASLAGRIDPDAPVVRAGLPPALSPDTVSGAIALNAEITRQAEMVSYVNTFWLMIALGLFCAPLILLLRQPRLRTRP